MSKRTIEPRDKIDIYIDKYGHVCIEQENIMGENPVIFLNREDVPLLIEHLQATYTDALDFVPESDDAT